VVEVEAHGLGKTFMGGDRPTEALRGIDLRVGTGEFVSLIGPSGSGKSTLLRLIGGLLDADAGTVVVGDRHPEQARKDKTFGFVPQTPALLPWRNVHDNVRLLTDLNNDRSSVPFDDRRVTELLDAVGLADRAGALPGELSGGMRQRVSLARAFALRAPVMLMDEPFSALDELSRSDMRYLLLDLWRESGATVVFVTHSLEEAVLLSDRVIVLGPSPGHIIGDLAIDLERPRRVGVEDTDRFRQHTAALRSLVRGQDA
jgi:NitT/TauT family transport system ATP-binding protein